MIETYYVMRQSVGPDGQKTLKAELLTLLVNARRSCGLPPIEPKRDQSHDLLPANAAACIITAYDKQQSAWASKLSGPAAEEAARTPERNISLQAQLQSLGLLSKDDRIDGVFGTGTRKALLAWQHAQGRPETGFFGDADAAILLADARPDPFAGLRAKPLAQGEFNGETLKIEHKGLQVTVDEETGQTGEVCNVPHDGILELGGERDHSTPHCRAIVGKVLVDSKVVLKSPLAILVDGIEIDKLAIKAAIRRLDSTSPQLQVVLTGYTGGAHCCTSTVVATAASDETWRFLSLDRIDGDQGFDYLDLDRDGTSIMVDIDPSFLYAFASYAGSFAPTRIRRLVGEKFQNVTRDPRYRNFLTKQLEDMEQTAAKSMPEPNGYLAAWLAQKALVGDFKDSWRTVLVSYDRKSSDGLENCAVEERLYVKSKYGTSECPPGQQIRVEFPQALASLLLRTGYITSEQAASVGYDAMKLAQERKAASARYEEALIHGWFVISNAGDCILSRAPASPAEMITADRFRGYEDSVSVLHTDDTGSPTVARVERPMGNGMVSTVTFYRGGASCEKTQREQQNEVDKLR